MVIYSFLILQRQYSRRANNARLEPDFIGNGLLPCMRNGHIVW